MPAECAVEDRDGVVVHRDRAGLAQRVDVRRVDLLKLVADGAHEVEVEVEANGVRGHVDSRNATGAHGNAA